MPLCLCQGNLQSNCIRHFDSVMIRQLKNNDLFIDLRFNQFEPEFPRMSGVCATEERLRIYVYFLEITIDSIQVLKINWGLE